MSSDTSSTSSDYLPLDLCQVCEKIAHGNHHGISSCRACAAFFRRSAVHRKTLKCREDFGNCNVLINSGKQPCKKCRLEKCFKVGMTLDNFQFQRDPFSMCNRFFETNKNNGIPLTIEKFVGRPHMIIRCEPSQGSNIKNFVDVNNLINDTYRIITNNSFNMPSISTLENLVSGLKYAWNNGNNQDVKIYRKIGKAETTTLWGYEFLGAAKWLNRTIEFQRMPNKLKMKLVMCIWYVWGIAQKLVLTAEHRSKNRCKEYDIMITKNAKLRNKNVELDFSWCSKYNIQQLEFYLFGPEMKLMEQFINAISEIEPTEHEKAFIIFQICLNFAAKIIDSEILPYVEKMQSTIYDEIHHYYVKTLKMSMYSTRLAKLLKCDRILQSYFLERKKKRDISKIFEIISFESSHPEMFETVG